MIIPDSELAERNIDKIGHRHYMIPCPKCGRKFRHTQVSDRYDYICKYCSSESKRKEKIIEKAIDEALDVRTKYDKRFDSAIDILQKQVDIVEWQKYIDMAYTKRECFGSVPEAVFCIVLLSNNLKVIPQQKVGDYRVDFALPDNKIVFEIDGSIYHSNKAKQDIRDYCLENMLGKEWKIIHIPSDKIKDVNKIKKYIYRVIRGQY